jgi:hypothetical protein
MLGTLRDSPLYTRAAGRVKKKGFVGQRSEANLEPRLNVTYP